MFQSLRINNPVYIFHKGNTPYLEVGYITQVSVPKPKYQIPPTFGATQELVVDITAKVNNQITNYNGLPAQLDVADSFSNGESIVISDNKEAMNAEILSLKQKSIEIVDSIEFHKNLIENCDKLLSELNPEYAEKQAQRVEIDELKIQMSQMSKSMLDLMETNKLLIEKLKKEN